MSKHANKKQLHEEIEPRPISATLYYYTPPVAVEIEQPPQLEPEQTVLEPIEAEVLPGQEEEELELVEAETPAEQPEEKVVQTIAPPPSSISKQPVESTSKNQYTLPVQDLVKGQLHNYQQDKLDKLAKQAATEYRRQLTSPTLLSKPQDSFVTEEEKFIQKITTSVDCSSATNQTIAIVMGIMGGAVKCSEPPPFDSFIQKRLNKTAELPALQQ
ncbi:hypothetical protein [Paraglaciecola hydrolytica]|uniref:Uncharacterized protein n=1 Tax=Paraglaciecola hydrolytica TaxID=1799789 RepID=A0A136A237_9ALTE|nr:hypothetical protein [Paraglaciecola hydrolytica]KXI29295.1 hypothetical protein AX660_14225 [Paraglaciecola hydrolytica]